MAEDVLLYLKERIGKKPSRTPEEEEFVVAIVNSWDLAEERGRNAGEIATRAQDILTVLRVRGLAVPVAVRKRILAEKDPARLERWHERAILAASASDVIGKPSRAA